MIPPLEKLPLLPEPFELLELADTTTAELAPISYVMGKATIRPRDGSPPKSIPVLRLNVAPEDKATVPRWWDVTSKTLMAGLLGFLEAPGARRWRFLITKHGVAPTARFTIDARPL
jgi:hypothetical protein